MRNPPAAYKHDDPTHRQFGESADSALLNKRANQRQDFASGGGVGIGGVGVGTGSGEYPRQGASGISRWLGAGPEHYAAMRSEMSPSDLAYYKSVATPEQYNAFMGTSTPQRLSPGEALDRVSAGTDNPSVQQTKDLAAKFGRDLYAQPQAGAPGYGGTTTVTTSGPEVTSWGGVFPSSQTNTYDANGREIGPKLNQ